MIQRLMELQTSNIVKVMAQKKKNQNEQNVKKQMAVSKNKSTIDEKNHNDRLCVNDKPAHESPITKSAKTQMKECDQVYDTILAKFDRTLEEIEKRFSQNERLTQRLLQEHKEYESFVDEFLNGED